MTGTGLKKKERDLINGVFSADKRIKKVVIFGSRANGTFKPNSDIDFAVCGVADRLRIARIASALDELPLPYKFDVLAYSKISSKPLLEHIDSAGRVFYSK